MALYDGSLTVWRRVAGGWERREASPARVEAAAHAKAGAVGPLAQGGTQSDGLTAYVPGSPDVRPGDRVAAGAVLAGEPPEGALVVESVLPLTLRGRAHHVEVTAR